MVMRSAPMLCLYVHCLPCYLQARLPLLQGIQSKREWGSSYDGILLCIEGHIHELVPLEAMPSTTLRKQTAGRVGVCWIQEYGSRSQYSQWTVCSSPSLSSAVGYVNIIITSEQHFIQWLVFELSLSRPTKLDFRISNGKKPVRSHSKSNALRAVGQKGRRTEE